ncbi:MAG: F0F1 ATP synthase subunit A [Alphaproteobacteria bacterium]|nr:F0F1 ATP synthase subunit A [Alphaproteobacteria bacterium]MBN2780242.1 F0F1 ATP synthase subunit A [Alphaproteobacteria bacterium]
MNLSPDQIIFWIKHFSLFGREWTFNLNMTIVGTWLVMLLIFIGARLATKNLKDGLKINRWQNFLETIVSWLKGEVENVLQRKSKFIFPIIASLFIFVLVSNLSGIIPLPFYSPITGEWAVYIPPTGSFSTTIALTLVVMLAVPAFGIARNGVIGYLKRYIEPQLIMLPFNIIGEVSGGASLAIRLYGNVMSGTVIVAILLILAPIFMPVVMQLFGLLTGVIQAYIFATLGLVYIVAGLGDPSLKEKKEWESLKETS